MSADTASATDEGKNMTVKTLGQMSDAMDQIEDQAGRALKVLREEIPRNLIADRLEKALTASGLPADIVAEYVGSMLAIHRQIDDLGGQLNSAIGSFQHCVEVVQVRLRRLNSEQLTF
jgi:hypothetical protein